MTMKNDTKFEKGLTCLFKIDMRNLKVVSARFLLVCVLCLKGTFCETRENAFSLQKLFLFLR